MTVRNALGRRINAPTPSALEANPPVLESLEPRLLLAAYTIFESQELNRADPATVDFAGQSNVPFDAIGIEMLFGVNEEGFYCRDLLQISTLLDKFANLRKPIHISAVQVPSATAPDNWDQ